MNRERLIQQVKSEYARLAQLGSQSHFIDQTTAPATAYYEKALQTAINDITAGKYDDCVSGRQVVERIANSPHKPPELS
ncbi:MAG TPA: hypothetical protein GXZ77_08205 [Papillibacter sp.]|jgi:hypothetical protein|nr:hypothetical protein [Papillibacter sp.]